MPIICKILRGLVSKEIWSIWSSHLSMPRNKIGRKFARIPFKKNSQEFDTVLSWMFKSAVLHFPRILIDIRIDIFNPCQYNVHLMQFQPTKSNCHMSEQKIPKKKSPSFSNFQSGLDIRTQKPLGLAHYSKTFFFFNFFLELW